MGKKNRGSPGASSSNRIAHNSAAKKTTAERDGPAGRTDSQAATASNPAEEQPSASGGGMRRMKVRRINQH